MGRKTAVTASVTALYKLIQKPALFNGSTRIYDPYKVEADGRAETQPPEVLMVQARFREILGQARGAWTDLWDSTLTQDSANTRAKADIAVDGQVLAKDVPVTTLMFLKKQVTDLLTFVRTLPTPDSAVEWSYDSNQGLLRSKAPSVVQRTKKVPKVLVKLAPTDKHPGQADTYMEDTAVGQYEKTEFCGGIPADVKAEIVRRVEKLLDAVVYAHEAANISTDAPDMKIADAMFDFAFAPLGKTDAQAAAA